MSKALVIVIYDGECRFCRASVAWLQIKLKLDARSFQNTELSALGLTQEECSKEVIAILGSRTYRGAAAIAVLLRLRGNTAVASAIVASGALGRFGYRWVAAHRDSTTIKALTKLL
ncbi:MAG: thiol-disulfide oxidoreductase DCC family protein, partial [Candidatus Nanopelagicales bacterium]